MSDATPQQAANTIRKALVDDEVPVLRKHNAAALAALKVLEDDRDRLSELNRGLTYDYNALLVEELRQRERAEAAVARADTLTQQMQRISDAVEAWDQDETPDEDFPFAADMDFVNFCGHVARAALAAATPDTHDADAGPV